MAHPGWGPSIFSTNRGRYTTRASSDRMRYILRSSVNDDLEDMIATLWKQFPSECKAIRYFTEPLEKNLDPYFDGADQHMHGTLFLAAVVRKISKANQDSDSKVQDYVRRWTVSNIEASRRVEDSHEIEHIFTDEDIGQYGRDFLKEAMSRIKNQRDELRRQDAHEHAMRIRIEHSRIMQEPQGAIDNIPAYVPQRFFNEQIGSPRNTQGPQQVMTGERRHFSDPQQHMRNPPYPRQGPVRLFPRHPPQFTMPKAQYVQPRFTASTELLEHIHPGSTSRGNFHSDGVFDPVLRHGGHLDTFAAFSPRGVPGPFVYSPIPLSDRQRSFHGSAPLGKRNPIKKLSCDARRSSDTGNSRRQSSNSSFTAHYGPLQGQNSPEVFRGAQYPDQPHPINASSYYPLDREILSSWSASSTQGARTRSKGQVFPPPYQVPYTSDKAPTDSQQPTDPFGPSSYENPHGMENRVSKQRPFPENEDIAFPTSGEQASIQSIDVNTSGSEPVVNPRGSQDAPKSWAPGHGVAPGQISNVVEGQHQQAGSSSRARVDSRGKKYEKGSRIWLGNLPKEMDSEAIMEMLRSWKDRGLLSVTQPRETEHRAFAFADFESQIQAEEAVEELSDAHFEQLGNYRGLHVSWPFAQSSQDQSPRHPRNPSQAKTGQTAAGSSPTKHRRGTVMTTAPSSHPVSAEITVKQGMESESDDKRFGVRLEATDPVTGVSRTEAFVGPDPPIGDSRSTPKLQQSGDPRDDHVRNPEHLQVEAMAQQSATSQKADSDEKPSATMPPPPFDGSQDINPRGKASNSTDKAAMEPSQATGSKSPAKVRKKWPRHKNQSQSSYKPPEAKFGDDTGPKTSSKNRSSAKRTFELQISETKLGHAGQQRNSAKMSGDQTQHHGHPGTNPLSNTSVIAFKDYAEANKSLPSIPLETTQHEEHAEYNQKSEPILADQDKYVNTDSATGTELTHASSKNVETMQSSGQSKVSTPVVAKPDSVSSIVEGEKEATSDPTNIHSKMTSDRQAIGHQPNHPPQVDKPAALRANLDQRSARLPTETIISERTTDSERLRTKTVEEKFNKIQKASNEHTPGKQEAFNESVAVLNPCKPEAKISIHTDVGAGDESQDLKASSQPSQTQKMSPRDVSLRSNLDAPEDQQPAQSSKDISRANSLEFPIIPTSNQSKSSPGSTHIMQQNENDQEAEGDLRLDRTQSKDHSLSESQEDVVLTPEDEQDDPILLEQVPEAPEISEAGFRKDPDAVPQAGSSKAKKRKKAKAKSKAKSKSKNVEEKSGIPSLSEVASSSSKVQVPKAPLALRTKTEEEPVSPGSMEKTTSLPTSPKRTPSVSLLNDYRQQKDEFRTSQLEIARPGHTLADHPQTTLSPSTNGSPMSTPAYFTPGMTTGNIVRDHGYQSPSDPRRTACVNPELRLLDNICNPVEPPPYSPPCTPPYAQLESGGGRGKLPTRLVSCIEQLLLDLKRIHVQIQAITAWRGESGKDGLKNDLARVKAALDRSPGSWGSDDHQACVLLDRSPLSENSSEDPKKWIQEANDYIFYVKPKIVAHGARINAAEGRTPQVQKLENQIVDIAAQMTNARFSRGERDITTVGKEDALIEEVYKLMIQSPRLALYDVDLSIWQKKVLKIVIADLKSSQNPVVPSGETKAEKVMVRQSPPDSPTPKSKGKALEMLAEQVEKSLGHNQPELSEPLVVSSKTANTNEKAMLIKLKPGENAAKIRAEETAKLLAEIDRENAAGAKFTSPTPSPQSARSASSRNTPSNSGRKPKSLSTAAFSTPPSPGNDRNIKTLKLLQAAMTNSDTKAMALKEFDRMYGRKMGENEVNEMINSRVGVPDPTPRGDCRPFSVLLRTCAYAGNRRRLADGMAEILGDQAINEDIEREMEMLEVRFPGRHSIRADKAITGSDSAKLLGDEASMSHPLEESELVEVIDDAESEDCLIAEFTLRALRKLKAAETVETMQKHVLSHDTRGKEEQKEESGNLLESRNHKREAGCFESTLDHKGKGKEPSDSVKVRVESQGPGEEPYLMLDYREYQPQVEPVQDGSGHKGKRKECEDVVPTQEPVGQAMPGEEQEAASGSDDTVVGCDDADEDGGPQFEKEHNRGDRHTDRNETDLHETEESLQSQNQQEDTRSGASDDTETVLSSVEHDNSPCSPPLHLPASGKKTTTATPASPLDPTSGSTTLQARERRSGSYAQQAQAGRIGSGTMLTVNSSGDGRSGDEAGGGSNIEGEGEGEGGTNNPWVLSPSKKPWGTGQGSGSEGDEDGDGEGDGRRKRRRGSREFAF